MKKLLLPLVVLVLLLASCEKTEYLDINYTISYETNGGTDLESVEIKLEGEINEPAEPTREDYIFLGWYSDEDLTSLFKFPSIAYSDLTMYARWSYVGTVEADSYIDLSSLPYSEYLDESNPVITIVVKGIGIMELELFPSVAPNTVDNLIMYIENGDFIGNSFHRVIEDFMIQGGNTNSTICSINGDFEFNGFSNDLNHYRGVLSMARTPLVNSATSQFFIVHQDSFFLDGNYATFGGLVNGFNVLDYIASVDTNSSDAPIESILVENITVELNGYIPNDPICAE